MNGHAHSTAGETPANGGENNRGGAIKSLRANDADIGAAGGNAKAAPEL